MPIAEHINLLLLPIIAAVALLVLWYFDLFSILFDVALSDGAVRLLLLRGIPVLTIKFSDIKTVRRTTATEFILDAVNLKNLRRGMFRPVLIETNRGFIARKFLVTPADPDAFIDVINNARSNT